MVVWIARVLIGLSLSWTLVGGGLEPAALRPGDHVAGVTLTMARPDTLNIDTFCSTTFRMDRGVYQPGVYHQTCAVAPAAVLGIGPRWTPARSQERRAWSTAQWMLYVDEQLVDLATFGVIAQAPPAQRTSERLEWAVGLLHPRGTHTVRSVLTLDAALDDGTWRYAAGTYDVTTTFTVMLRCRDPHTDACWRDW